MATDAILLDIHNLEKNFAASSAGQASVSVLSDINLSMHKGESLAIVGPSGCGKSTLLNLIGTLDRPSSGTLHFNGHDLGSAKDAELTLIRNREIGFIFQEHHLLPQCSVLENVLLPTLAPNSPLKGQPAQERALKLLDRVGLSHRLQHRPGQLSGGERQRTAVVRALINEPLLILADEPTGSLDHSSAANLADLLVEINKEQGVSLILVTHAREIAARMGRMVTLQEGKLVSSEQHAVEAQP